MAGAVFFVVVNLFWLMANFKWASRFLRIEFQHITDTICSIGLYTGIIHCCMQWHKLGPDCLSKPSSTEDERTHMLGAFNEGLH
jgi:hypothetical protein